METYAHSFFTWALAKHGVRSGRSAGIAGAVGAALPDVPSVAGTAYYVGAAYLSEGWGSMSSEGVLSAIYFTGPFGATGSALHSIVPVAALLGIYAALRAWRFDLPKVALWLLVGWAGHAVADFLTHAGDGARPLFWPISDWEWRSPVSYYDPDHYGVLFMFAEHGLILLVVALLLFRRLWLRSRRKGSSG